MKAAPRITISSTTTYMAINYNAIIIDGPVGDAATAFVRHVFDEHNWAKSNGGTINMMSLHILNDRGKYIFTVDGDVDLPENWNEFVSIVQRICQLKAFW